MTRVDDIRDFARRGTKLGRKLEGRIGDLELAVQLQLMAGDDFFPEREILEPWPWLLAMLDERQRLLAARQDAVADWSELAARFAREDDERDTALVEQVKRPDEAGPVPLPPSASERQAQLDEAADRVCAADLAWVDWVEESFAVFAAKLGENLQPLGLKKTAAEARIEEARRVLDEAEAELRDAGRLANWFHRAADAPGSLGPLPWPQCSETRPANVFPLAFVEEAASA